MPFGHINRRAHLYLGLVLLPWFLMYGISSVMFSHGSVFGQLYRDGVPNWTTRLERPYSPAIPEDADDRQLGARILEDLGLEGAFGTYRPNMRQFNVYLFDFWSATRISYFLEEGRLLEAEALLQEFRGLGQPDQLLTVPAQLG